MLVQYYKSPNHDVHLVRADENLSLFSGGLLEVRPLGVERLYLLDDLLGGLSLADVLELLRYFVELLELLLVGLHLSLELLEPLLLVFDLLERIALHLSDGNGLLLDDPVRELVGLTYQLIRTRGLLELRASLVACVIYKYEYESIVLYQYIIRVHYVLV